MKKLLLTLLLGTVTMGTLKSQNFTNNTIFIRPYLAWQDEFRLREGIDIGANINNNLVSIYTENFKTNNQYIKWFLGCRYGRRFAFDKEAPDGNTFLKRFAIVPSLGIDVRLNGLNPGSNPSRTIDPKTNPILDYSQMKVDNMLSLRLDCATYFSVTKTISLFGSLGHQYYWAGNNNNSRDRIQIGTMIGFSDLKIK
jgi:hypothetical protein